MDASAIERSIQESIAAKQRLLEDPAQIEAFLAMAEQVLRGSGKLLFCGNGGSSCDAAHAVAELVGWFLEKKRGPLPAIALGHEIPSMTAIANDAGYEEVFARQLEALGREGDLLIGISTSGNSANVRRALEVAERMGLRRCLLTGSREGSCDAHAELCVRVPSDSTPRIQEGHLLLMHLLCEHLERAVG